MTSQSVPTSPLAVPRPNQPLDGSAPAGEAERLFSLNALEDGWRTEYFNTEAGKQLKMLADLLSQDAPPSPEKLAPLLDNESFACAALAPSTPSIVFEDDMIQVSRGTPPADVVHHGARGLGKALDEMSAPLHGAADRHGKFKIIRVTPHAGGVTTVQFVSLSGRLNHGMVEQNAVWRIEWSWPSTDEPPVIRHVAVEDFEQIVTRTAPGAFFVDCTQAAFRREPAIFDGQFNVGVDRWVRRLEAYRNVYQFGHNGLVIGDVNSDGLDDVYSCQVGGLPNRLLLAQPDGTVREAAAEAGVDFLDNTRAALLIDLDNDDDQDLVLTLPRAVAVLENDGAGRFTPRARITSAAEGFSLAAADADADGDLDLYVCVYYGPQATAADLPIPMPVYDANNGGANLLLRNEGDWKFSDVTAEVGLDENNSRFSFAAVWEDYDNDGDPDLYVVNDFGRNNLHANQGGRFSDVTDEVGLIDGAFGMSAAAADYNRDGWIDFYKANMFSSAGNRVTYQPQFMPGATEEHRRKFRYMAQGNALFENVRGEFHDTAMERGVFMGRWSWGSLFVDFNNDGWEDLFVTNGFVTGSQTDDL